VPDNYLNFSLDKGLAYFASSYTPKEYRNLGIGKYIRFHTLTYCRENNFKGVILNIDSNNLASIKLAKAMGFKEYQRVSLLRFLGLKLYRIKDSNSKKVVYKFGSNESVWNIFYGKNKENGFAKYN